MIRNCQKKKNFLTNLINLKVGVSRKLMYWLRERVSTDFIEIYVIGKIFTGQRYEVSLPFHLFLLKL